MIKKNIFYSLIFFFVFLGCSKKEEGIRLPYDYSVVEEVDIKDILAQAKWDTRVVAEGVTWKSYQFNKLFDGKQYLSLLEVDLSKGVTFDIPYVTSGFLKTSEAAIKQNALVAFNGSYFNTTSGGSTVFFKKEGQIIKETNSGFSSYRENGAIAFGSTGVPSIIIKPSTGWKAIEQPTALAAGPLLILNNQELNHVDVDFNTSKNPRTAVGITKDNKLLVLVVDGRSSQSRGVTIPELSKLMYTLGCVAALNLDGGGSSTAWVKGFGVVNHPSDNGKFDHEGERGVATVITVKQ